jgi:hypothetical protein
VDLLTVEDDDDIAEARERRPRGDQGSRRVTCT